MNYPAIFLTKLQKVTVMKFTLSSAIWFPFGCATTMIILTAAMLFVLSGGFYDNKKGCYYAPINSSKCGDKVEVANTRPYTAMPLNLNPLMAAFQ